MHEGILPGILRGSEAVRAHGAEEYDVEVKFSGGVGDPPPFHHIFPHPSPPRSAMSSKATLQSPILNLAGAREKTEKATALHIIMIGIFSCYPRGTTPF